MSLSATGPWDLPIEGFEILTIRFHFPLDLVGYGENGATVTVRFAGPFTLTEPDGRVHDLDAERNSWEELAVVLGLRHDKVSSATVSIRGELDVRFTSGRTIRAQPDGSPYETWEVTGPDFKLVAMPGDGEDGVAVWNHT